MMYSAPVCLYGTLSDSLQFDVIHLILFCSFLILPNCTDSVMSKGKFVYMRTAIINKVALYCIVLYCIVLYCIFRVPELLTDIMNLEALLIDDDIPPDNSGVDPNSQEGFYNYMMQLTELRLYKLVRWARNLPQFGAISVSLSVFLFFLFTITMHKFELVNMLCWTQIHRKVFITT